MITVKNNKANIKTRNAECVFGVFLSFFIGGEGNELL